MMCSLQCNFEISLLIFVITAVQLSIAEFSSCIPEEYRGVRREIWKGLNGGWYLTHLTSDSRFPNSPTEEEIIATFTPPINDGNHYGQRLQAYFVPPISGNYSFYATCDSECAFYLSLDEKPGNKKELIRIDQDHRTGYDQWDRYPLLQRSCFQQLERGKLYYIEALHCNFINNDHVRIHIKLPGSNTTRPLDREYLFLYSPGSSVQTTCVLLRRCGVTCGGGLDTRITTRGNRTSETCVKEHGGAYKEAPSLRVQAYNITASTAVVAWNSLIRTETGVVDFSGYRVSLKSEREASRVRLVNTSVNLLLFEGLHTFANYCVTVEPLTVFGSMGKEDGCYDFVTDDDTPDLPPQNITAVNTGQSSITVRWKPIPDHERNGIILGYKLTFKIRSATDQLNKSLDHETHQWPRFETVMNADVYHVVLRDVKLFTWYCLKMLAFTRKGDGAESCCVFILTQEGVPSRAPVNVTTMALNSTSFAVTWQPVPPDHVHGIVVGYKILLENMDDSSPVLSEKVDVDQNHIVLRVSKEVSRFCVRVLAFTSKGDGKKSNCIEGWTWSKETLFPAMTAVNHGSPTDITITWDKPRDQVLKQLKHYHVTYEAILVADYPVNSSQFSLNVSADLQQVSLKDLETYTTYKITVKSVMSSGAVENKKVIVAKTCRCPNLMFASWIPTPPYVIKRRRSSEPRGLIPDLLAHMLQESCGTCFSYKTWNISYTINTSASITEPDKFAKVDFRFPVRSAVGRTTYRGFHTYVPLITVPGVALMTRKKTPSGYARDLGHSVLGCWPIFAVSIVLAVLTGVIIWFAESKSNGEQFFTYQFHKGVVEGIWWSFVTMTTVGYGDRYPKTIIGRSIAIVWFLTGIVLSSLLVSSLTSSMSVRILDKHLNVAHGKKIGALAQFPEYDLLIRFISKAGDSSTFPTLERLVNALKYGDVDGILVDLYTANYRSDLFNVTWMVISQIISADFTSGVVISGNAAKLEQHFRDYVGNKSTTVVTEILQKTNEENSKNKITSHSTQSNKMPLLDPSTPIYHVTIFILLALLGLAVFMGLVYHSWYKGLQKRQYDIQAKRARQRREYLKAKLELRQMVDDFYQRFTLTYQQMRLKHRKQLERFKVTETLRNGKIPPSQQNGVYWV